MRAHMHALHMHAHAHTMFIAKGKARTELTGYVFCIHIVVVT